MSLEVDPNTLRVVQISTGSVRRANIYDTQVGVVVCGFDANGRCSPSGSPPAQRLITLAVI